MPRPPNRLRRSLLIALGWITMGLAVAGAVLPLLPTTPFLLLSAACLARSSPELHRRLLANRRLGPYLHQWQQDRSVPRGAKRRAYVLVFVTFAFSIALVDATWQRILLVAIGVGLLSFLALLRTAELEEVEMTVPLEDEREGR